METVEKKFTNQLINESSPYLLQHAHNPVNWFPWSNEAIEKSRNENKPILVSIGYAACHWCHVMEHESFENEEVAMFMNENFINIKIDREERPDLDNIYMEAVQIMSGSGGWPLNVFLTPALKPFYGGTYFPPKPAYNRPGWIQILNGISQAWHERKNEIINQSNDLTELMQGRNDLLNKYQTKISDAKISHQAFKKLEEQFDKTEGGIGSAPKFPSTYSLNFLMQYYFFTKNESAIKQVRLSLDKMMYGGIYDQIGGGFSRYSTDDKWLAPHFEKMLYDNALLVSTYADAYKLTKDKNYLRIIDETLAFVNRELKNPDGGFYSSLDADSEGVEGKFYVWDKKEIENILKEDTGIFCSYYNVSEKGNWEGKNILNVKKSNEEFSKTNGIEKSGLEKIISEGKKKLLMEREKRISPALDDKIILSWNALMISAFANASKATGNKSYAETAISTLNFLFEKLKDDEHEYAFHHNYKNGESKNPAFLDDYASLIKACINVYELTFEIPWLSKANDLAHYVIEHFSDTNETLFFFTPDWQNDIVIRKKEYFDNAIASGNSMMAENLYKLGLLFDKSDWRDIAINMYSKIQNIATQFSSSFGNWLMTLNTFDFGFTEIVITGKNSIHNGEELNENFLPINILVASKKKNSAIPLLKDKQFSDTSIFYLCRNYSCDKPVNSAEELLKKLDAFGIQTE